MEKNTTYYLQIHQHGKYLVGSSGYVVDITADGPPSHPPFYFAEPIIEIRNTEICPLLIDKEKSEGGENL